jgi:hypothetical protein
MTYAILQEVIFDTLLMLPWLFLAYFIIEVIEYKYGNKIRDAVQHAGSRGPVIGALAGVVPQCSFSVVATALYGQRLATIGTLLAVYIATSDEAIPIILSQPGKASLILPLIFTKVALAIIVGFLIDYFYKIKNRKILKHIEDFEHGHDDADHNHQSLLKVEACCGHDAITPEKSVDWRELLFHPFVHTLKIAFFVFLASLFLAYVINSVGETALRAFMSSHLILQPFIAGLIGLIPNCAASVAITQFYLDGSISFGSVIAGLSASGGLGLLVLFRVEKNKKEVLRILTLLFGFSVSAGLLLDLFVK